MQPRNYYLTTDEEKIQRLNETDLDNLIIQKFTKEFSKIRPVNFIQDILIKKLLAKGIETRPGFVSFNQMKIYKKYCFYI